MPPSRQPYVLSQLAETYPDSYIIGKNDDGPDFIPAPDFAVPDIDDKSLCAIAFTSGSTGAPQPNKKYWYTLNAGARGGTQLLFGQLSERINLVATVPPQHMWGMETSIILPLFQPVAITARTPFYPQDIVDVLNELPEPVILVSSPIHLEALLKSGLKPERLDRILTATAPLSQGLAADLESAFDTTVQDVFGSSESGIIATRNTAAEELWTYAGYFDLKVTRDGLRIRADHLPEDVLLPDVIELIDERQYRWVGRQTDMVKIAGKRGSLADLNQKLREIPGVVDAIMFARKEYPDRLAALIVAPDVPVSEVLQLLREKIDPVFVPRPILAVEMLPRQETGKISLKAVQDMFGEIHTAKKG